MLDALACVERPRHYDDGGDDIASLVATVVGLRGQVSHLIEQNDFLQRKIAGLESDCRAVLTEFGERGVVNIRGDNLIIPPIRVIKAAVCERFGVTEAQLISRSRQARIALARHIGVYLCCRLTRHSTVTISRFFGYADHTPVHHGRDRIAQMRITDRAFDITLSQIEIDLCQKNVPTKES